MLASRTAAKPRIPRSVKRVAGLVFTVALIYFVVGKLADQKGKFNLLAHINLGYVGLGLALEVASLLSYAFLSRAILSQSGRSPRMRTLVQIDMSTLGLSRVLPGGSAAGTGMGYRLLTEAGVPRSDAGLTLAVQSIGSAAILNILLWIGLVISIPLRALTHAPGQTTSIPKAAYVAAALVGALLVSLFGIIIVSLTKGGARSLRVVRALSGRLKFLDEDGLVRLVGRVSDQLRLMATNRSLLLRAVFWASANWLFDAAVLWVMLAAFGYRLPPDALLVSYCLANVVAALPITPGGLGVVELVLISTLTAFGAPSEVAALGVIAYRVVSFWLPIPFGGLAYLTLRLNPRFGKQRVPVPAPASES
ncbi:MAG: hypothetical protein NVSMB32_05080 [Actinomycetota bacterium]